MYSFGTRSTGRRLAAIVASLALLAATALPAVAVEPPPVDGAALTAAALEQAEAIKATIPGVGLAGPVVTFNEQIVVPVNVQVVASPNATADNVSQTAQNAANVDQGTSAQSGTASGESLGVAISGPAVAGSIAVVTQLNIQVIAGWVPEGGVSQDATNAAVVSQETSAASGDAAASDGGLAISGVPVALSTAGVNQENVQIFVGEDPESTIGVAQVGENAADVTLTHDAATGPTEASGGFATSGNAVDLGLYTLDQHGFLVSLTF